MMLMRAALMCLALALPVATAVPGDAAVVQVTDALLFPGGVTTGFAGLGEGSVSDLTLFAATPQQVLLASPDGLYFDGVATLSTVIDLSGITFDFAAPVTGLAVLGGVIDEFFGYVDAVVTLTLGGVEYDFTTNSGTPTFFGVISDTPISTVGLSIRSFDVDATSVAFLGIDGVTVAVAPIPLPATLWLLFGAVGLLSLPRMRRGCFARCHAVA